MQDHRPVGKTCVQCMNIDYDRAKQEKPLLAGHVTVCLAYGTAKQE